MRVIAGIYRGRVLAEFKGKEIRPTSDMARESLFNILRGKIEGASFLDLFCGTGAVGIEALSRGAKKVLFNDISSDSVALTQFNLNKLNVSDNVEVRRSDATVCLKTCAQKFDIVFIDAPYKSDAGIDALREVESVLSPDGIAIYENETPFDGEAEGLEKYDARRYGRAHLTFFRRKI